jgi:hypothetical protein
MVVDALVFAEAQLVLLVQRAQLVPPELEVVVELEVLEILVLKEHKARQVLKVFVETLVQLVLEGLKVILVLKEERVPMGVKLVARDQQVLKVILVLKVLKVKLVLEVILVQQVLKDLRVLLALKVKLVILELRVLKVLKGSKGRLVLLVVVVLVVLVIQVLKELLA